MAKTKQIKLYYYIRPKDIIAPPPEDIQRKNDWIKVIQENLQSENDFQMIETTYKMVNPEVEKQRRFFNGPVISYYIIQNQDIPAEQITTEIRDMYRETILWDTLGYDIQLIDGRKERSRGSTTDFTDTQDWSNYLETLKETYFDPQGYEFPDSDTFKELRENLKEQYNLQDDQAHRQAEKITLKRLWDKLKAKMSSL